MREITYFKSLEDAENLMKKIASVYDEEVTDDFVFEGNSNKTWGWFKKVANVFGITNIAILTNDYNKIMKNDLDFIDTIYIKIQNINFSDIKSSIDLSADEIDLYPDGLLRLWWD